MSEMVTLRMTMEEWEDFLQCIHNTIHAEGCEFNISCTGDNCKECLRKHLTKYIEEESNDTDCHEFCPHLDDGVSCDECEDNL